MAYEKQNFKQGQILTADQLNHIEDGLAEAVNLSLENKTKIDPLEEKINTIEESVLGVEEELQMINEGGVE